MYGFPFVPSGGGGGSSSPGGLYSPVLHVPTQAGIGLTNWLNQNGAAVADISTGISLTVPGSGSPTLSGIFGNAPAAPYKITALISQIADVEQYAQTGFGWYNGTDKLVLPAFYQQLNVSPVVNGGVIIQNWSSFAATAGSPLYQSLFTGFPNPVWIQIEDDGTNVYMRYSTNGKTFFTAYSVAKASGYLGANGYTKIYFGSTFFNGSSHPSMLATLMSYLVE
jgi:hypothetical protein